MAEVWLVTLTGTPGIYAVCESEELAEKLIKEDEDLGIAENFDPPTKMEIWDKLPAVTTLAVREATWRSEDEAPAVTNAVEYHYRFYAGSAFEVHNKPTGTKEPRFLKVSGTDVTKVKEAFDEACGQIIAERMGLA